MLGRARSYSAILAVTFAIAAIGWLAVSWANAVHQSRSPVTTVAVPPDPAPGDTSPRAAAEIGAAAAAKQAQATRDASVYAANRSAEASERTGRRAFIVAVGAGLLALLGFAVSALTLQHEREASQAEIRRADRLHLTRLFD